MLAYTQNGAALQDTEWETYVVDMFGICVHDHLVAVQQLFKMVGIRKPSTEQQEKSRNSIDFAQTWLIGNQAARAKLSMPVVFIYHTASSSIRSMEDESP